MKKKRTQESHYLSKPSSFSSTLQFYPPSLLFPESLSSHNKDFALENGFRVFQHMQSQNIAPTEATITQVGRLAAAKNDPDFAFEFIKTMKDKGIMPRLRTYGPALFTYDVENHMRDNGVRLEEAELSALIRLVQKRAKTTKILEKWFRGEKAAEVGDGEWMWGRLEKRGRGEGRVKIEHNGQCCGCGERLVCVDIDCGETEKFAQSVASLALEREVKSNFKNFMEWIDKHADYEAIVDGANIGLSNKFC
ncbi:Proteinaceous RNase P 3 [Bienertia sinuspersici]